MNAEQREKFDDYCDRLMKDQVPAPNEFVGYMLAKLREARVTLSNCEAQIQHLDTQAQQLLGGINRYQEDINEWVARHLFPPADTELEVIDGGAPETTDPEPPETQEKLQ